MQIETRSNSLKYAKITRISIKKRALNRTFLFILGMMLASTSSLLRAADFPAAFEAAIPVPGLESIPARINCIMQDGSAMILYNYPAQSLARSTWDAAAQRWTQPQNMGFRSYDGFATFSHDEEAMYYGNHNIIRVDTNGNPYDDPEVAILHGVQAGVSIGGFLMADGTMRYYGYFGRSYLDYTRISYAPYYPDEPDPSKRFGSPMSLIDLNSDDYAVAYPYVTPDHQVLLYGKYSRVTGTGSDIWMASWDGSHWVNPRALGPEINTSESEEGHPVYCPATRTLYFNIGLPNGWSQGVNVIFQAKAKDLKISCPADVSQSIDPGQCSAVVNYPLPLVTDDYPGVTVSCAPPPGSIFPQGITVTICTAIDTLGNTATCSFNVTVTDTEPPKIACPADIAVDCSVELVVPVTFSVAATDNCEPSPSVICTPPSGSSFAVGITTVNCTAADTNGNSSSCAFRVAREALAFTGFLAPIDGADATGGSYATPLRTFKMGSTIPVKFTASCEGAPVVTGLHRLQVIKYTDATTSGDAIDASPQDTATEGNQFRLTDGKWQFNLDTKGTHMSVGRWVVIATLSDSSQHSAWIQIK